MFKPRNELTRLATAIYGDVERGIVYIDVPSMMIATRFQPCEPRCDYCPPRFARLAMKEMRGQLSAFGFDGLDVTIVARMAGGIDRGC